MNKLLCEVKSSGLLTTIQDLGRPGFREFGVPVSGAMDRPSARLANELVANPDNYPLLEITQTGPTLVFHQYGALAITGADLSPTLNGIPLSINETLFFSKGDELSFGKRKSGIRAYLAFAGKLSSEELFKSTSTHLGNGWGGLGGNALKIGDKLHLTPPEKSVKIHKVNRQTVNSKIVRVMKSLEFAGLNEFDKALLFSQDWLISSESNRVGIRLSGTPLTSKLPEMISSPTDTGIVQLPPNGQPIVLMNDSSSIGGYPRIFAVLQEDIPMLAQKPPGASVNFKLVN